MRRRAETPDHDGALILPRELTHYTGASRDYHDFWTAQRAWFKTHGIDWRDWDAVRSIIAASHLAHGIDTAEWRLHSSGSLVRAWLRSEGR